MYKNPWRGQIVLSPLYLELEFAALHTPGICCRGSISLACTAAFLQDWINSLLFIVQHPEKLCFMHSNNITSLWGQEKKLSNTLAVMVRPAFFSVMCRPWAQTELVQTPHVPSWLLLPNALEHSLPVCSLAVPCWQSSCGQGGNPAVTCVQPVGLQSGREEGARPEHWVSFACVQSCEGAAATVWGWGWATLRWSGFGHRTLLGDPIPGVQCSARASSWAEGVLLQQRGHGDTEQVLEWEVLRPGHRKSGRTEARVLRLRSCRCMSGRGC